MSKKNDGGYAFPMEATDATAWRDCNQGMTLRDYFAAKVLQGVMASGTSMSIGTNHEEAMLDMARAFYSMADAMIKARELP
ncbi:hypothetical protein ACKAAW_004626 [Enterobacter hormaechei]|uniref:Gp38 n=1 Tax=Enterobacter hormaechei TaxID=158836 RepID=A0ABD4JYI9_9ENTR|nr:hypothetical protein [Enterobacter hormaechei]MBE8889328.1 hypothetical protein [Enterobacter hormaechei]MBE9982438.1 hypothetical protein [Enterobacter hormaechei]MBF1970427.1 hypothetical protein [Enterobacter hormaechei]